VIENYKKSMRSVVFLALTTIIIIGFGSAFAEPITHTVTSDKGTLDVRLTYDEIIPGQMTTLKTEFLKPGTQEIQPHIDWQFTVTKEGEILWGPTQLSHTSEGILKNLRYQFEEKGKYNLEFSIEGILFQIIPTEKVNFVVVVGEPQSIAPPSIDAYTSKKFYEHGESVGVTGKIQNYDTKIHGDLVVEYVVFDPQGLPSTLGQTHPSESGAFNFSFVAKGQEFEPSGDYTITINFGSSERDLPMYLSEGKDAVEDNTPPVIAQHEDIEVIAETADGVTPIDFSVTATDNVDKSVKPTCKPQSGFSFGIGETVIKCTAKDSSGNFALPMQFSVIVNPPVTSIPSWVKNVAGFWCQDQIDNASFIEGIQYLIDNGIIIVPAKSQGQASAQEIPQWVKNNACWWSEGSITDLDFASGIQYLVKQGIIVV
jgi:hypothetical protein